MNLSEPFFWWRLEFSFSFEFEEFFLLKLEDLGIDRFSLQFKPDGSDERTLFVWLPSFEWQESDRYQLVNCLISIVPRDASFRPNPVWTKVENEDWSSTWKQHWQPDPVGNTLLILPAWLDLPNEYETHLVLRLDPGIAFGTGSHPTTRLCLEALERNPPLGLRVADLGCGSGILGLAALGFGAKEVFAADIDSLAVRSTMSNVRLNRFSAKNHKVVQGSVDALKAELNGQSADLLLCNILASVIETLAPEFDQILTQNGTAILSGLLVDQVPRLVATLEGLRWRVVDSFEQERWVMLQICRG